VELGHNLDIGCIRLERRSMARGWISSAAAIDVLSGVSALISITPGLTPVIFSEIIGADVEGIKVFVAPSLTASAFSMMAAQID